MSDPRVAVAHVEFDGSACDVVVSEKTAPAPALSMTATTKVRGIAEALVSRTLSDTPVLESVTWQVVLAQVSTTARAGSMVGATAVSVASVWEISRATPLVRW